ncbi:MAG TPA: transcription elongation factor GreB [Bdellovibrionales bacterium]|nr:transcription elongation factor GreB [Bdellovibrionales bacterium]
MNEDELEETEDTGDDESDGQPAVPAGSKNYITPPGAERLRDELKHLRYTERPEVVRVVAWAASNGDRSENADYIYGKRRLREIDRRLRFLQKRLDAAEVVDPKEQKGSKVLFGATVTVKNEGGELKTYQIVGVDETDPSKGKISWISPLGKALLQNHLGDSVYVQTPRGEEELEIVKVEYK